MLLVGAEGKVENMCWFSAGNYCVTRCRRNYTFLLIFVLFLPSFAIFSHVWNCMVPEVNSNMTRLRTVLSQRLTSNRTFILNQSHAKRRTLPNLDKLYGFRAEPEHNSTPRGFFLND